MKNKGNFKKMMGLYKGHVPLLMLVLIGTIISSSVNLAWPILTKYILDNGLSKTLTEANEAMPKILMGLGALLVLDIFGSWVLSERASVLTDHIKYGLNRRLFQKYQRMSFSYFDNSRAGNMITLLNYDVDKVDEFIYNLMASIISLVIDTIGAFVLFSRLSWKVTAIIMPLLVATFAFNKIQNKYLLKSFQAMRNKNKELMEYAEDRISGVRTVVAFGKEYDEYCHFINLCEQTQAESKHAWRQTFIRNAVNDLIQNMLWVVILVGGGYLVIIGQLKLSDLTLFLMYSYMITNPINNLSGITRMYNKANASYEHIAELLNAPIDIDSPRYSLESKIEGNVSIDKVSFKYNTENDCEFVITDLTMNISAGKMVAIVGPSGSGKSTIAGLIPRYYDVCEGSIKIDGINVKDFDLHRLRRNIGVVQQDIYLFYGTIYDNIAYAKPGATMEDVITAAKSANAHDFISDLPNGYNSNIGDRGVKLSGGQKQRIAIARVFLENPPIVIFDEATSALDNESEKKVQQAMENLSKKRTTIVIAHRLSTIRNADEIFYLTKHGIEEHGNHEELMKLDGKYSKLYATSQK